MPGRKEGDDGLCGLWGQSGTGSYRNQWVAGVVERPAHRSLTCLPASGAVIGGEGTQGMLLGSRA